jgi:hypothetical protein
MAARKTGLHSYEAIAVSTLGRRFGKFVAVFSVIGITFCALVAYMNLWGDLLLPIIQTYSGLSADTVMMGTS